MERVLRYAYVVLFILLGGISLWVTFTLAGLDKLYGWDLARAIMGYAYAMVCFYEAWDEFPRRIK